ncbi:MAG TPA: potassium-transporting ATPase subunit KdpC [Actinomycetota bacterium]
MMRNVIRALRATVVLAILTGLVYPLVMTGVAQVAFRGKADGSLVRADGRTVGSSLIGQAWTGSKWFYGRPSATATPYDAASSSGSNLGPLSKTLADQIEERVARITDLEGPYHPGLQPSDIPVDLLTASASGLDPDISPAAAAFQAPRIAAVRGIPLAVVQRLIDQHTEGRTLGFLGEPRVNVLELNLALAQMGRG